MADVKFAVVNATSPASTGTQNYTSSGFGTPKGFYVIMSGVSSGDLQSTGYIGRGASDLTNTWAIGASYTDAGASEDTQRLSSAASSRVIFIPNTSSGVWAEADYSSTVTDGIQLNWVKTPGAGFYITIILIGGADAAVAAGNFATNNSAVEKTITTNIDQKIIIFDSIDNTTLEQTSHQIHGMYITGFSKAYTPRWQSSIGCFSQDNAANGNPRGGFFNAHAGGSHWATGPSQRNYQVTNNSTTSFGFTSTGSGHSIPFYFYLAIDTGDLGLFNDAADTPTSTGDWARTGFGFTPQFVMGWMIGESTSSGVNTAGLETTDLDGVACQTQFFSDGTNDAVHGIADEDAAATINTSSVSSQGAVFLQYDDTQATKHTEATVSSFDSDGVTFNFTTAVAARYVNFFAIEEGAAAKVLLAQERAICRRIFGRTFGRVN